GISATRIFFLVDDNLFIEPFSFADLCAHDWLHHVPSLRLAAHLDYCYTRGEPQRLPKFHRPENADGKMIYWIWSEGEHDWGFPLAVDGHIFCRREIEIISE